MLCGKETVIYVETVGHSLPVARTRYDVSFKIVCIYSLLVRNSGWLWNTNDIGYKFLGNESSITKSV